MALPMADQSPTPSPDQRAPAASPLFLTGGTGHTGSRLVRALAGQSRDCVVLTRNPDRAARTLGVIDGPGRVRFLQGDLEAPTEALSQAMRGCRALVALSHIRYAPVLIDACRNAGQIGRASCRERV